MLHSHYPSLAQIIEPSWSTLRFRSVRPAYAVHVWGAQPDRTVTEASSGFGRAMTEHLLKVGNKVVAPVREFGVKSNP